MATVTLRSVGGSVVMAIPKRLLEIIHLQSGAQVDINVKDNKLVVEPHHKPNYTLHELLAQCDFAAPLSTEEQVWLDEPPTGAEEI